MVFYFGKVSRQWLLWQDQKPVDSLPFPQHEKYKLIISKKILKEYGAVEDREA